MNDLITIKTKNIGAKVVEFLIYSLELNDGAIEGLKKLDAEKCALVLEKYEKSKILSEEIIEDAMYLLTQNPLAKNLRRTIAYQFMTKLIEQMNRNTIKIANFALKNRKKLSKSSVTRINKMDKLFRTHLHVLVVELESDENNNDILREIVKSHSETKTQLKLTERQLLTSLTSKKEEKQIKERLFVYSICEAIERNDFKLIEIIEYLFFISTGIHKTFF